MKKKYLVLIGICVCSVFLSGCEKVRDLTDEETELIAEYTAELLLKHDINYVDRIEEGNEQAKEIETESEQEDVQDNTTEAVSAEKLLDDDNGLQEESIAGITNEQNTVEEISDIADIIGVDGASITFKEYAFMERYPATDAAGEIYLDASEGYQLLVLYFNIMNNTDDMSDILLIDKEVDYRIVCNETNAAKPMLTILMDDLATLETNLQPGETQEAVLIFQVSDDMKKDLEKAELYISYNGTERVLKILQ